MSVRNDPEPGLPPFEPELHISPFRLFRWLQETRECWAEAPVLLDVSGERRPGPRLRDARPFRDAHLPKDRDVVLVDRDGVEAAARARRLREAGHRRVRALWGGLELYDFALDPAVVGAERFLLQ